MSYKDPSYVIFDGDNDKWAYGYMKGWKQNDRVDSISATRTISIA